ncbi:LamG domain-containing protein [Planococcus beigongshangi]|uniref:LamG domain-containing protein n=1 Tax=Planococcus beigongshangi TaxID=2782536 RepID=UPI00193AE56E|nr:LamG domain-containing protein [Planococcus beigongshangi]
MLRDAYIGEEKVARIYTGDKIVHPSPVMDGLVLWYDFMGRKNSDAQRTVAEDLSGNGNDGTLMNFAYTEGSGYENGLVFDHADDYVQKDVINHGIGADNFTCDILFKVKSFQSTDTSGLSLVAFGNFTPLLYIAKNENSLYIYNGGRILIGLNALVIDKIHHVLVKRESRVMHCYVDGKKTQQTANVPINIVNGKVSIGQNGNKYDFFNGFVYSAKVYNRALTPEEIAHNYAMEKERWNL